MLALLAFLALSPAHAEDNPEVRRLANSMDKLAQKNAWDGVERAYVSIEELGGTDDRGAVMLGADSARHRGDVVAQMTRLHAAQVLGNEPETAMRIDRIRQEFGKVELICKGPCPLLLPAGDPFRPDHKSAIAYANAGVVEQQTFEGFIPVGTYKFGYRSLEVNPGNAPVRVESTTRKAKLAGLFAEIALPPTGLIGKKYKLLLNGAGVHEDDGELMYVGALYTRAPVAQAEAAVNDTWGKRILVHWLTDYTAEQMADHWGGRMELIDTAEEAWAEEQLFMILLETVEPGDRIFFDWNPKQKSTRIWVNERDKGDVDGEAFMRVLWQVFLGDHTPSEELKAGMLGL